MGRTEIVALIALLTLLMGVRHISSLGRGLADALEAFKDALNGGGPRGPHPLPGDDSRILNRRRAKQQA